MKHTLVIFLISLMILPLGMDAQVSKQEKKFWKKKAKSYSKNPLNLKSEFENYEEQIKDLKEANKKLLNERNDEEVATLTAQVSNLENRLQSEMDTRRQLEQELGQMKGLMDGGILPGLVYRVQIGAYVFYDAGSNPEGTNFVKERSDGFNKYLIGAFRTYDEASEFRNEIEKMGIKKPWVVPYLDGVRVSIEEAENHLSNQGTSILDD
ncbi:MAG: SPOR domain-containing protein [Bacteroidia bacterium]|nr:SPOR domain-containing protein [Bacteroidia bacterium]